MKALSYFLTLGALLMLLTGCGKDNKSGQGNGVYDYSNPYSMSPMMPGNPYGPMSSINSPYSYGGISVNQVMAENTCISGFGGMGGFPQPYANQRIPIQIPLTNFPTVISPNDVYVGVTSYGDVAALIGTAPGQPPLFVAYLCPRSFAQNGTGQLMGIKIGAYT